MQSPLTIRPGLLVSLKTSLRGGVSYQKATLEPDHAVEDGRRARWETTRTVANAEEYDRATVARNRARSLIAGACNSTAFGLLCPSTDEANLTVAIDEARRVAADCNADAQTVRVDVYVIAGRIRGDEEDAARAIASEVRDLLARMESAIAAADPAAIRDAADRARAAAAMLTDETQAKVSAAIAEVRKVARQLVKVEKAGETAAAVVDGLRLAALDSARFAVLDMLGENETAPEVEPVPVAGIAVDLPAEAPAVALSAAPVAPAFDF